MVSCSDSLVEQDLMIEINEYFLFNPYRLCVFVPDILLAMLGYAYIALTGYA